MKLPLAVVPHGAGPARSVEVQLGFLKPEEGTPASTVMLSAGDEATFHYVVNLLAAGHNGEKTFELTAPSTYVGDRNVRVTFFTSSKNEDILCEVACKPEPGYLTHDFLFCTPVGQREYIIFGDLVKKADFYYIVPALNGEPDFDHVVLPKYIYRTVRLDQQ